MRTDTRLSQLAVRVQQGTHARDAKRGPLVNTSSRLRRGLTVATIFCLVTLCLEVVSTRPLADALSGYHGARHRTAIGSNRRARTTAAEATVTTSGDIAGTVDFQVGDDYTQTSHLFSGTGGNPKAVSSATRLLTSLDTFQDTALMGWGEGDPEPSPGRYEWSSLDARVELMGHTVPPSQRMITLCSAPGWMKVGGESQEWNMNAAVAPAYFSAFADLAAQVAERYDGTHRAANGTLLPQVDYFNVWNSMKGFWDTSTGAWNSQAYTTMYNDVYRAIKAVRPDAQIGGPYAPVGASAYSTSAPSPVEGAYGVVDPRALDVITYWLQHKVGSQFVSLEGGPAVTDADGFSSGQYFVDVANWLRGLNNTTYPGATTLPLMWTEFYPGLESVTGKAKGQEAVAIDMSNVIQAGLAGVNGMFIWEMEGNASGRSPFTGESVWTDTATAGGGKPTTLYTDLSELHHLFPPGATVYRTATSGPITTLAAAHSVLVVSHSASPLTVDVNQLRLQMKPYAVMVVPTSPA